MECENLSHLVNCVLAEKSMCVVDWFMDRCTLLVFDTIKINMLLHRFS